MKMMVLNAYERNGSECLSEKVALNAYLKVVALNACGSKRL